MKNIVISLEKSIDRRKHIEQEFTQQNISFSFFNALTPDLAKPLAQSMQLSIKGEYLTDGELACFMSHVSLWQKMIDEQIPYMAIFEDDIYLGKNADRYLVTDDWIDQDWHIIKLEAFAPKVFLSATGAELNIDERQVFQLQGKNLGAAGYILSLQGAQAYLEYVKSEPLIAVDLMMFDGYMKVDQLNVYQMVPALCIQEMMLYPEKKRVLSSNLVKDRKIRMQKNKKTGWAKVQLEIMRIINQIRTNLFGCEVKFK